MIDKKTPAFPLQETEDYRGQEGMSLRDYFAAKALNGMCANPADDHVPEDEAYEQYVKEVARCAYALADAMMEARK